MRWNIFGGSPVKDEFGREIEYLRVSVTDRCNLRCVYCMPPDGVAWQSHNNILRYEEIARVVQAAAGLGMHKVRLTGGEPLVRPQVERLVEMIAAVPGIQDISMTTNAVLLAHQAQTLARAGLRRVNVSLDTLRPDRFAVITRGGQIAAVWRGIRAAEEAGLVPLKLNVVVARGMNDDELVDFARLTFEHAWEVRFIELMPLANENDWGAGLPPVGQRHIAAAEVQAVISQAFGACLQPVYSPNGNGPATLFRLPGAPGTLGFISPVSQHFCPTCNRLRLTADGKLRPCLLDEGEVDIRAALRNNATDDELRALLVRAIRHKPERHRLDQHIIPTNRVMAQIGG